MKFYSEILNKMFDTLEELNAAENEYNKLNENDIMEVWNDIKSLDGVVEFLRQLKALDTVYINQSEKIRLKNLCNKLGEKYTYIPNTVYSSYTNSLLRFKAAELHPEIEQLLKAGFDFIIQRLSTYDYQKWERFYKICFKSGSNIKDITGLPKWSWDIVKRSFSFQKYNDMRILITRYFNGQNDKEFYSKIMSLNQSRMREFKYLINSGYYDTKSLKSYLDRIDFYQAIPYYESIPCLCRYIKNCKKLKITPNPNSSSLKRDLDVTMRDVRRESDRIDQERYEELYKKKKVFEFKKGNYSLVLPKNKQELVDEGREMHNCVGGYWWSVSRGSTNVLFMKDNNGKSVATIEVSNNGHIRQQLAKLNRAIEDADMLEFLKDYEKYLGGIN